VRLTAFLICVKFFFETVILYVTLVSPKICNEGDALKDLRMGGAGYAKNFLMKESGF